MTATPTPLSLQDMAEEIFGLSVMAWRDRLATKTTAAELSESQFLTLNLLQRRSPQTVGELQRAIGVLPAQMSRIIRSLEDGFEEPLIRCERNQPDKRKIDVTMTEAGQRVYGEFRRGRLAKIQEMLGRLPEGDRLEFARICRALRELYQPAIASNPAEAVAGR